MDRGNWRVAVYGVWLAFALFLFTACSKELSREGEGPIVELPVDPGNDGQGTGSGQLVGNGGSCDISVLGAYGRGLATDTSNYALAKINFTATGTYIISSDTLNGVYFRGTGDITAAGVATVRLNANGTPTNAGPFSYQLSWKGSECSFTIEVFEVVPEGSGDYFPMTANSNWSYASSDPNALPEDTLLQVSTGLTGTLPDGTIFNLFTTNYGFPDLDSSYYRKAANDYRELGDVDAVGVSAAALIDDFVFLRDDQPVGTKWETQLLEGPAVSGSGTVRTKRTFELISRGGRVAVNQKIYLNVIKIATAQVVQNTSGGFDTVISYESWYAKGIGLINLKAPPPYYGYGLTRHQVF